MDIFAANPYEGHPALSETEAEVLWEYAKLAQNIKMASTKGVARENTSFFLTSQL
jgi:DASH complex subunit DAD3